MFDCVEQHAIGKAPYFDNGTKVDAEFNCDSLPLLEIGGGGGYGGGGGAGGPETSDKRRKSGVKKGVHFSQPKLYVKSLIQL